MGISEIIKKFESKDSHLIWEATWQILRCNDVEQLGQLKNHINGFKKILSQVDMGGGLRRNADDTMLAFSYIEQVCQGVCRCYLYSKHVYLDPRMDAKLELVTINSSQVMRELCEQHFDVSCNFCHQAFKVREIIGGHVPWYEWKKV